MSFDVKREDVPFTGNLHHLRDHDMAWRLAEQTAERLLQRPRDRWRKPFSSRPAANW